MEGSKEHLPFREEYSMVVQPLVGLFASLAKLLVTGRGVLQTK